MMRILGIVLIMGATLWFGAYFAMKEKYRLQELEGLQRALIYLQGQITYLSAPLAEAMESISWKTGGQLGSIFQQAAENMSARQGETAEQIWQEVWQKEAVHTFLAAEDLDAILVFGRSLGYLDKAQQENSIQLLLRYIEDALAQGRKRLEKNGRLYYGMGCLSGLLIVVTLL
ncbi:MAG: stage III sporulation protein AB [Anaerotignum sp.]|nr:stage III sporulation protein AB [Anaerotignum sp.]